MNQKSTRRYEYRSLSFAQDFLVANTAAATLRQLVNESFDRVVVEDRRNKAKAEEGGAGPQKNANAPELPPCAMDAYLLFQVCLLCLNAHLISFRGVCVQHPACIGVFFFAKLVCYRWIQDSMYFRVVSSNSMDGTSVIV